MLEISVLWFVNKEGELLLAKRSLAKSRHPDEWGPTLTGTGEVNETPEQTLIREVEEELGLKPNSYSPFFLFKKDFNYPDEKVCRFSIYCALVEKKITDQIKLDEKEVACVRWLPMNKVREMLVVDSTEYKIVGSAKTVWPETFDAIEAKLSLVL